MQPGRREPQGDPVSIIATGRWSATAATARTCGGASPVRLSAPGLSAGSRGITPNHKKLLRVRRRGGRKRALGTRAPMVLPDGPNQRCSLDCVSDTLTCSRRFRILCVVDDYTRECLALVAGTSLSGVRVARELTRLIGMRGRPHTVVSDNGTELISSAILRWSQERRVEWHYIAPGKSMQNGFVERLASPAFGQRSLTRPMPQRDAVHIAAACPLPARCLAARLQPRQATLETGRENTHRESR